MFHGYVSHNQMVIQVISHRHTLVPPSFQQRFITIITQVSIRPHCHAKKFAPILRLPSFLPMRHATVTFRNFHAKQVLWSERHHSQCGIPSVRNRDVWSIAALIKSRTTFLRGERENGQSPVNRMVYHIRANLQALKFTALKNKFALASSEQNIGGQKGGN